MNILQVEDLTKTYGSKETMVTAVDHISFSVNKGEYVAIVGQSGSGKSTLLHMIGGVETPSEGRIFVDGKEILQKNQEELAVYRRRQVGLIYQFYNLIPILSAEENIVLPMKLDGKKADQTKLDDLIKTLGLEERRKHLPKQLSGGQQQRVSIGRALLHEPALILADEPTGNLDKKNGEEIASLLRTANTKYHQTLIVITHDEELAHQADRIIRLQDGKIVSDERLKIPVQSSDNVAE